MKRLPSWLRHAAARLRRNARTSPRSLTVIGAGVVCAALVAPLAAAPPADAHIKLRRSLNTTYRKPHGRPAPGGEGDC